MKNLSLALVAVAIMTGSGAYAQTSAVITTNPLAGGCGAAAPVIIDSSYRRGRFSRPGRWFTASGCGWTGRRTLTQSALIGGTNSVLLGPSRIAAFDQAAYHLPMIHVDAFRHRLLRLGPTIPSYMEKRI